MKKLLLVGAFLLVFSPQLFASSASVIIHENTVNEYLKAIGTISGKGTHKGVKYTWYVKNAHIQIKKDNATFIANAEVKAAGFKQGSKVKGNVDMVYDKVKNRIAIKVNKVIFNIYIKVLGAKVKVASLDLAKYYKPKFEFAGPQPIQKQVTMDLPNGKKRTIDISSYNHQLVLANQKIIVNSDVKFTPVKD